MPTTMKYVLPGPRFVSPFKAVTASLRLLNVLRVFRILRMRRLKRTVSGWRLTCMHFILRSILTLSDPLLVQLSRW